jgi:FkbM family methyltransferase
MGKNYLGQIFNCLSHITSQHGRGSYIYELFESLTTDSLKSTNLNDPNNGSIDFGPFGEIRFPYFKMGAIDTLDLFGLDELIIFAFYFANRNRYNTSADIGANLGLHSILMSKCGWLVQSFEPDPVHMNLLKRNLALNKVSTNVTLNQIAVSDKAGTLEFLRILGNTTGSHLAGAKPNPYGEIERFNVNVAPISDIIGNVDFIKMDVEGQERQIILSTSRSQWINTDMMVEVGTPENAKAIFEHLNILGVNTFSQKTGWRAVKSEADMPNSHREGSLFISLKDKMPWG